jgi:hypothetical protein
MFFPGFQGIKPIRGLLWSIFLLSITAQVVGLVGFLDGFTNADGTLDLALFDWRPAPLIYGSVLWGVWIATMIYLLKSKESRNRKIGAGVWLTTPVALCVLYLIMAA